AALVIAMPRPTARGHSGHAGARRAVERGAAAIVWVFGMLGNPAMQPMGATYPIPAFTVGLNDGNMIEGMIGRGERPLLHLRADVEHVAGLTSGDVYGVLPGTTDENVVIVAHFDSFFAGALDNASGVAGMVALAEYFAAVPRERRRRNIIFAGICCHHDVFGLGGTPTASRWMVQEMRPELDRAALVLNMEHLSQTQTYWASPTSRGYAGPDGLVYSNMASARRWYASGTDAFKEMVKRTWRDFGVATYVAQENNPGGELGAFPPVAPSLHIIDHTFYHTTMDTPELVPASGLQNTVQAFAKIIDEVNRMDMRDIRGAQYPVF
ncbi:MAG TPA: M28 family peptidase, partial [Longimicrobiales bacterium]|nr:M28 family peptidase [Longimicrobiales bacterium]